MADDWTPEPRPVPDALRAGYKAPPFEDKIPFEHDHIRKEDGWASFGELLGPEGVKKLFGAIL